MNLTEESEKENITYVCVMSFANQVLHQILSGFVWEEEALKRAKQSFLQSHETLVKSLEGRSTEMLMDRMSGGDNRFMSIPQEDIEVRMLQVFCWCCGCRWSSRVVVDGCASNLCPFACWLAFLLSPLFMCPA